LSAPFQICLALDRFAYRDVETILSTGRVAPNASAALKSGAVHVIKSFQVAFYLMGELTTFGIMETGKPCTL